MPDDSANATPGSPVAVLNPEGRDPHLDYAAGAGSPASGSHPPVNFHAFAACSRGAFCRTVEEVLERDPGRFHHVILLLRRRLHPSLDALRSLRDAGCRVVGSWKECGASQSAAQLNHPRLWPAYGELLSHVDALLSPAPGPIPLPSSLSLPPLVHLATPYPVDLPDWDFSTPLEQREGLFVGTREFFQPGRNHAAAVTTALRVARRCGTHVTVINTEKRRGRRLLQAISAEFPDATLQVREGTLPYPDYLSLMASHRLVFQLDQSNVPGQVAGDALLCRSVCVGGTSAVERIAFPEEPAPSFPPATSMDDVLGDLLRDDTLLQRRIDAAQNRARDRLSFQAGARELGSLFRDLEAARERGQIRTGGQSG